MAFPRAVSALLVAVGATLAGCGQSGGPPSLPVGATADSESALLANLYAAALRSYGTPAHVETVPDPVAGLDSAAVAVAPGLTGQLLGRFEPDATARSDEQVYRAMVASLPEGVAAGDYTTSAQDKPALAVTEATADRWDGHDLSAALGHCRELVVGAVAGAATPTRLGTCRPAPVREFPDTATLYGALHDGRINAAWTSTAAPGVPAELVVLADRTALIRAENVVPLYRRHTLDEQQVLALNEVAGVLDTAALTEMLGRVDGGADPAAVADGWLSQHPLGR